MPSHIGGSLPVASGEEAMKLLLIIALAAMISTPSWARSSLHLKGITAIKYNALSEKTAGGDRCVIPRESLAIALEFVANQSTKLKLIPSIKHDSRSQELNDTMDRIWKELTVSGKWQDMAAAMENPKYIAAKKAASDYAWMPHLRFYIYPIETNSGCGATVEATLHAFIDDKSRENLLILPTRRHLFPWTIELWSDPTTFICSKQEFSSYATQVVEEMLKEFVNDWTTSQELEDFYGSIVPEKQEAK